MLFHFVIFQTTPRASILDKLMVAQLEEK